MVLFLGMDSCVDPVDIGITLIEVSEFCSNVTFGGPDGRTLFLTCSKKVYSLAMRVRRRAVTSATITAPLMSPKDPWSRNGIYRFRLLEYRESPQNNAMFRNDLQWGRRSVDSQELSGNFGLCRLAQDSLRNRRLEVRVLWGVFESSGVVLSPVEGHLPAAPPGRGVFAVFLGGGARSGLSDGAAKLPGRWAQL